MRITKEETRELEIKTSFSDEPLHVTYFTKRYSPKFEREFKERYKSERNDPVLVQLQSEFVLDSLLLILAKWDLEEGEGKQARPYPLTKERLEELPNAFLTEVFDAITADSAKAKN